MMKTGAKMKVTEKPVIMVEQVDHPLRNSIYNKSLENFTPNGSVSDFPKRINNTDKKKKIFNKISPQVKKGVSMDINTDLHTKKELFKSIQMPPERS
jgi:hypothetical protein